jgi:hypothetical protein
VAMFTRNEKMQHKWAWRVMDLCGQSIAGDGFCRTSLRIRAAQRPTEFRRSVPVGQTCIAVSGGNYCSMSSRACSMLANCCIDHGRIGDRVDNGFS